MNSLNKKRLKAIAKLIKSWMFRNQGQEVKKQSLKNSKISDIHKIYRIFQKLEKIT
jgi:hypothetical protein